jgi:pyruvate/2-oxoacid:ferredoxin oxidoreductase alpha subunit
MLVSPFLRRLGLGLAAVAIATAAVATGAFIGTDLIAPALPTGSTGAPVWTPSRFEKLTLDVNAPDPFPYRTPTPYLGPSPPPFDGATIKKRAHERAQQHRVAQAKAQAKAQEKRRLAKAKTIRRPIEREAGEAFAFAPQASEFRDPFQALFGRRPW